MAVVVEADCSLLPHIVEHNVDHIDLRQFARLNEKTSFMQYLFLFRDNASKVGSTLIFYVTINPEFLE